MKILILRFSSIGDIVLTTPVIRCLKKQLPEAKIHYATKSAFKSILENNPYVDKIHILSSSTSDLIKELKSEQFDVVLAVSVLEFVSDIQKALNEIKRILKKDGLFITICPMESKLLDFFLSLYTTKKPEEEFGNARKNVIRLLENNFIVEKKGYMIPLIGKLFPVYTHLKLKKK